MYAVATARPARRSFAFQRSSKPSISAEIVARAFRLAYFLRPDQEAARRVTATALAHLDPTFERQDRRSPYRPRKNRTKAKRDRVQWLQHLVVCVASSPEHPPHAAPRSRDDLLIDFLFHLVRITTRRNSFYVNLGISRILYGYSTAETVALQDFLTQDPERVPAEAYFRYAKRIVTSELSQRFGSMLQTVRKARGEHQICSVRPNPRQARLVDQCLRLATPWQTRCVVPESVDPRLEELSDLAFRGRDPDGEHAVEWSRMHTVLHPDCYARSTRALGLGAPGEHLRIPRFFSAGTLAESADGPGDRVAPALGRDDLAKIEAEVEVIAAWGWR